jgi:FixJ family two-component response regulator
MSEQQPTVFIVDDDEAVRDGLCEIMKAVDHTVKTFASAQEFLDSYEPSQPGCLVLDVRMPGMSGLKLQQELLARDCHLPIIFVSGHGDIPMAAEAFKKGAIDFIEKPVRAQALLDRVDEALEKDCRFVQRQAQREEIKAMLALLTSRERQVLDLVRAGKLSKIIAGELGISQKTVDVHRSHVMEKMKVESVAELITLVNKADGPS